VDNSLATLKALFPERLHKQLFLVGGMVRDILLGVPCQDFDLAAAVAPSSQLHAFVEVTCGQLPCHIESSLP
jgi:tRNA nucleotidyltransferase (CCA-adding enzyme)